MKFCVWDLVANNKLDMMNVGEVIGYVVGGSFLETHDYMVDYELWDTECPGWREEVIYLIACKDTNDNITGEFKWFPESALFNYENDFLFNEQVI